MKVRNLDDLAVLLKVVDCHGFSAAARAMDLAPATVSKQIARLERALGARLFDRNTRQLRITDEGRAVVDRVRAALDQLDAAAEVARQSTGSLTGVLRLTAPVPLGARYLAPLVAQFRERHPRLGFELRLSDQIIDLYADDVELAVRVGQLTDSRLVYRRVAGSQRILVASPDYLRRHGTPSQPRELERHACLLFNYPGLRLNHWRLRRSGLGHNTEIVQVGGELRSDNGDALRSWSVAGLGIALRETWNVADELRSGSLVRVLPEWAEPEQPIQIVRIRRDPIPGRVSAFADFIAEQWRQPPWQTA
ncbi:LysR family transcriptional regulator [Frateuria aurantia]